MLSVNAEYIREGYTLKSLKDEFVPYKFQFMYNIRDIFYAYSEDSYKCEGGTNGKCSEYIANYNGTVSKLYDNSYYSTNYVTVKIQNSKLVKCDSSGENCTDIDGANNVDKIYLNNNNFASNIIIIKSGNKYGFADLNEVILTPSENYELLNETYSYEYTNEIGEIENIVSFPILFDNENDNYLIATNDGEIETISKSYFESVEAFTNEDDPELAINLAFRNTDLNNSTNSYNIYSIILEESTTVGNYTYIIDKYKLFDKNNLINENATSDNIVKYEDQIAYVKRTSYYDMTLYDITTNEELDMGDCNIISINNYSSGHLTSVNCNNEIKLYDEAGLVLSYNPQTYFNYKTTDNFIESDQYLDSYYLEYKNEDGYIFLDVLATNESFNSSKIEQLEDYYAKYKELLLKKLANENIVGIYSETQMFSFSPRYICSSDVDCEYTVISFSFDNSTITDKYDSYTLYVYEGTNQTLNETYPIVYDKETEVYTTSINNYGDINVPIYVIIGTKSQAQASNATVNGTNSTADDTPNTGAALSIITISSLILISTGILVYKRKHSLFNI